MKTLEEQGIGRPSTYAPTISTIQNRHYVTKTAGRFTPAALGITVCDLLNQNFPDIMDAGFTAQMEEDLDEIAQGNREWCLCSANSTRASASPLKRRWTSPG